jgi:hypothetical protein
MQQVLLDGTTLMSATQLLHGEQAPSALNVFSLALLTESLILHDELIVLDTLPHDDRLSVAARSYGAMIRVERHSVAEMVDRYVGMEFPELADLRQRSHVEIQPLQLSAGSASPMRPAEVHLSGVLDPTYDRDAEMTHYLATLEAAHERELAALDATREAARDAQQSSIERYFRRRHPRIAMLRYGLEDAVEALLSHGFAARHPLIALLLGHGFITPAEDGTETGALTADPEIRDAWESFVERYTAAGSHSTWQAGKRARTTAHSKFTPAMLVRTHFYLLASEVLGAPYRPDILRAPICWKFFGRGSFADFALEERFVDAAEHLAQERIKSVNEFLGRPAFAGLPLFLARVLKASATPADIIPEVLALRESATAQRFREYLAAMHHAESDGDIQTIAREISRFADLLRREFGGFGGGGAAVDVAWSLAASAGRAAVDPTPAAAVSLATDAAKGAVATTGIARRWWYRRKVALIAKTVQQANKARSMQPELSRLFGAELDEDDVAFLAQINEVATPTA